MVEIINSKMIPISKLVSNTGQIDGVPKNPRFIKDDKFQRLVKSLQDNPEFLGARELIVYELNGKFVVLCGNMRYRAAKELGYKELPCKVIPEYYSTEQIKAIIIKDNISFGQDDFDLLANEWDVVDLVDWGMDLPNLDSDFEINNIEYSDKNKEIDIDSLDSQMTIKLNYTEDEYWIVKEQLLKIAQTPEQAVWKLLGNE